MDWRQLIIDNPILAMLVVLPIVGFGAAIKIGMVLWTGHEADAEAGEASEDEPSESKPEAD